MKLKKSIKNNIYVYGTILIFMLLLCTGIGMGWPSILSLTNTPQDAEKLSESVTCQYPPKEKFIVLIYVNENTKNLRRCFDSVLNQNYPQDKIAVCVIDDHTQEDSVALRRFIKKNTKTHKNWGHLFNDSYMGYVNSYTQALSLLGAQDDNVVVCITGGDELNSVNVLGRLNDEYVINDGLRLTMGNYISINDNIQETGPQMNCDVDWSGSIAKAMTNSGTSWYIINPKTFKYDLLRETINKGNYQNTKGKTKTTMTDYEFMLPLLINSDKKFKCIQDVLYNAKSQDNWIRHNIRIR